ncbi:hypothetical protein R1flu_017702 [Riccia fluitans]|uniref:Integrase catalytic domain-containing protein n=1 Tax=Riccia fluitans TaxID=41844 RepID=A0ABD1ZDR2_9MARC
MYSFMDGFSGYNQVSVAERDREKTAFITEWGAFAYRVMPFGLKNAPSTFQRIVTTAFEEYLNEFMQTYLDDFIVYGSRTDHLRKCLEKCRKFSISLNPDKSVFGALPCCSATSSLRTDSFRIRLRLMLSYRWKHQTDQTFEWSEDCQVAFDLLRNALVSSPILVVPDWNKPKLIPAERNYTATERETLAIVWAANSQLYPTRGRISFPDEPPAVQALQVQDRSHQDEWYALLRKYLSTGEVPEDLFRYTERRTLLRRAAYYRLGEDGNIYRLCTDQTYRKVALAVDRPGLMFQAHASVAGGHLSRRTTAAKLLSSGLYPSPVWLPEELISDQGSHFVNQAIKCLVDEFFVSHKTSTTYYPRGNGQAESTNKILITMLHKPRLPQPTSIGSDDSSVYPHRIQAFLQLEVERENAENNIIHSQQQQQRAYQDNHPEMQYHVGDLVLWYKGPVPARSGGKFQNRWFGPYVVSRVTPNNVVALETLDGEPLGQPVNDNQLKPYKSIDLPGVLSRHPPAATRIRERLNRLIPGALRQPAPTAPIRHTWHKRHTPADAPRAHLGIPDRPPWPWQCSSRASWRPGPASIPPDDAATRSYPIRPRIRFVHSPSLWPLVTSPTSDGSAKFATWRPELEPC